MSVRVMMSLCIIECANKRMLWCVMLICAPVFEWACTNQTEAMLAM